MAKDQKQTAEFTSTALSRGSYDPETQTMELTMAGGKTYTFELVPENIWDGLVAASSPGTYFHAQIKGRF